MGPGAMQTTRIPSGARSRAIGKVFPMYPLTVAGLKDGVKKLRVAV